MIQDQPLTDLPVIPLPNDLGFMVLRRMSWEEFTQWNEVGEKVPIRVEFGALPSPNSWVPIFLDIDDARLWADGGLYPIILLTHQLPPMVLSPSIPAPCIRCGVIHWVVCPFDDQGKLKSKEERDADNERASRKPTVDGDAVTDHG